MTWFLSAHSLIQPHSLHGNLAPPETFSSPRGGACLCVCVVLSAECRSTAVILEKRKDLPAHKDGRANENTGAKEREAIFPVTWLSWDHPDAPVPGLSTCRSWQREAQPLKTQLLTCYHCVLSAGPRVAAQ